MSELNREQIIKALTMCWDTTCTDCEFNDNCGGLWQVLENAISLIKEFTKEVEDLKAIAEQYQKQFEEAKEDTVRKMQERFKMHFGTYVIGYKIPLTEALKVVNQIAKDMLEGEK